MRSTSLIPLVTILLAVNHAAFAMELCTTHVDFKQQIVTEGFKAVLKELKSCNAQDAQGNTLLHTLVECGSPMLIKYLLASYPNVNRNIQNNAGETPLHVAAGNGNRAIVEALLGNQVTRNNGAGADATIENYQGYLPQDYASSNGYYALAEYLRSVSKSSSDSENDKDKDGEN